MSYKKSDVTFHREYLQDGHAAVNIKVRGWVGDAKGVEAPAWHDGNWCSAHYGNLDDAYEAAYMAGWEAADALAQEVFGEGFSVAAEGRSGGWLVVTFQNRTGSTRAAARVTFDEDEVAGWDAVALSKWRRFETQCRAIADTTLNNMVDFLFLSVYPRIRTQCGDVSCPCSVLTVAR